MRQDVVLPPSLSEIEALARQAYTTIPPPLRAKIANVPIRVQDFPDPDTVQDMALNSPFDLMGLYRGVSLERQGAGDVSDDVDMIFLYRRPILDYWCETEEPLAVIVRHVLIHEIGHHFGFSDEDMAALEDSV